MRIPNDWDPRPYQLPLLTTDKKRAVCIWHRRAGKDSVSLNLTAIESQKRVGVYWHMLPTATQARKVVWDGIDREGRRIIDQVFPPQIRRNQNSNEMRIELANGSIWQCVGSDNFNALVGANPVGVVFSEYSVADPQAWDYIRPILLENDGWAVFIYTPRGKNHGYRLYNMAREDPQWHAELLTVDDTGVLTPEDIEAERRSGMSEEMIQQEYFCSFESSLQGAYYGRAMDEAKVTSVPYDPSVGVVTAWDIGIGDSTAIWFAQFVGNEIHLIDYYENSGEGIPHYANVLHQKPYSYKAHYAPHDIRAREMGSGKSRLETAAGHGIQFRVVPKLSIADGIEAVRATIPRCWFDAKKCDRGIEALKSYRKRYNEQMETWSETPLHDWSSHAADAFRYLATARKGFDSKPIEYPNLGIV